MTAVSYILSPNGRWIAGSHEGNVTLWEVRGINLTNECTIEDRYHLNEFRKIFEKAKEMNASYHLTP